MWRYDLPKKYGVYNVKLRAIKQDGKAWYSKKGWYDIAGNRKINNVIAWFCKENETADLKHYENLLKNTLTPELAEAICHVMNVPLTIPNNKVKISVAVAAIKSKKCKCKETSKLLKVIMIKKFPNTFLKKEL